MDAVLPSPDHTGVACLRWEGRVAPRTRPSAALTALKVQDTLEFLKGRTSGQVTVGLREELDTVVHGPPHSSVTLLTGLRCVANVTRLRASTMANLIHVRLEFGEA